MSASAAESWCDICKLDLPSENFMPCHVLSRRHKQNAKYYQQNEQWCSACRVRITTSVESTKEHLLSEQHQQMAKVVLFGERVTSIEVTEELCELEIRDIYDEVERFGELLDFRFSVVEMGETKPKHMSKIYVKYQTRAAGRKARLASQTGQLMCGDIAIKMEEENVEKKEKKEKNVEKKEKMTKKKKHKNLEKREEKKTEKKVQQKKKKKKQQKKKEEASRDPIDHTRLLTRLGQMLKTQTEDDVLSWLADQLLLTPDEYQQRVQFCQNLQAALRSKFPACLLQVLGSSVSGLGFHGCDLDMYFIGARKAGMALKVGDMKKVVLVAKELQRLPEQLCTRIVSILSARVPIVKFRAPSLGDIQCDLSFRNAMSSQNSRLVRWMMLADPRVRLVTVAVRYWAQRRQLGGGDRHPLKMSSYCLTLLVVTFLQQLQTPVLPSVDWCQAPVEELLIGPWNSAFTATAVWRSTNTTPASELLRQFFRFYADFAAELEVLCPLLGKPVPRTKLMDHLAGFRNLVVGGWVEPLGVDKPLVVQDPMELNYNVARNLYQLGLNRFRQCCREAADMPLTRLFDEEALSKAKRRKEQNAVGAAAAVVAAAADSGDRGKSAENDSRPTPDGGPSPTAAACEAQGVTLTADPALLRRVLAIFDRPPVSVVSLPLALTAEVEKCRHAAAFARFLEEVFRKVLRFEYRTLTFDGLDPATNVVRGFSCSAHLPTWELRTKASDQLGGPRQTTTLEFEAEVTELALQMSGQPAPTLTPLSTFYCCVLLKEDQLTLHFYKMEKKRKACHPFVASFLRDLAQRVDYVKLFGERRTEQT